MKTNVLWIVAAATGLLAGCAEQQFVQNYHMPLTSPGSKFVALPPAAQNSIRAEAGSAEIANISNVRLDNDVIYEIRFRNADLFPPLYVARDGSVLSSNLAVVVPASEESISASTTGVPLGMKLDDLPPNVVKTIRDKAPTAEIANITKLMAGKTVNYEISFRDAAQNPKLVISDDGTLLRREW